MPKQLHFHREYLHSCKIFQATWNLSLENKDIFLEEQLQIKRNIHTFSSFWIVFLRDLSKQPCNYPSMNWSNLSAAVSEITYYILLLCSLPPAAHPNTSLWASGRCQTPNLHLTHLQILVVVLGKDSFFFLWKVSRKLFWKLDSL